MGKLKKTNAMRILDKNKLSYNIYQYDDSEKFDGMTVARINGLDPNKVFKTLVTQGTSKEYYVFMIPVTKELNLKKAAKAAEEKKVEMIPLKSLLSLTGYISGGCSPIGMRKMFKTFIDEDVLDLRQLIFSGGRRGIQLELSVDSLLEEFNINVVDICD